IDSTAKFRGLIQTTVNNIRNSPGVLTAGVATKVPLNQRLPLMRNVVIEGQTLPDDAPRPVLDLMIVSTGYVETLRTPLLRGRLFTESDGPDSPQVAMVNDSTAKRFWPSSDATGRHISLDGGKTWKTIVGVLSDVRQYGLDRAA